MTVIQFLAAYARLFMERAAREYPALVGQLQVTYHQTDTGSLVSIGTADGPGIDLEVQQPLDGVLTAQYTPILEDDQWKLFLTNLGK